jgi:uncharacterized protein YgiM (DUF1202 family)
MCLKRLLKTFSVVIFAGGLFYSLQVVCFAQELAFPFKGEVNDEGINIRCDSTVSAEIITNAQKGLPLEIVSEKYGWYKVQLPKQAPAYVKKTLVECMDSKAPESMGSDFTPQAPGRCQNGRIAKERVNIRLGPGESFSIIGKADQNEIVSIVSETQGWYKITPLANCFGWIHKRFVNKAAPEVKKMLTQVQGWQDSESVVIEGTVRPHGFIFKGRALHKLITKDKKIFLLIGDKASLRALNHRKAKVTGRVTGDPHQKYPTIEVKILEVME